MNQGVTEILNKLDRLNERLGRIERRLEELEKPTGAPETYTSRGTTLLNAYTPSILGAPIPPPID